MRANKDKFDPVRVFLASPSDLSEERNRVEIIVSEFNRGLARKLNLTVELVRWETHASPAMGRPQQVILDQAKIENSDIFIGILWLKFGSPPGKNFTGMDFESGTQEEFQFAFDSWRERGSPRVMFYRCQASPEKLEDVDPEQLSKVNNFFKMFSHDGATPGLYRSFDSTDDFERKLREDLAVQLQAIALLSPALPSDSTLSHKFQKLGYERLILPNAISEKMRAKIAALTISANARLLAHSGHSFLGMVGHRYRAQIEHMLQHHGKFEVVLTNPWSMSAFYLALSEQKHGTNIDTKYLANLDPVETVRKSAWYSIKLQNSLHGIASLGERFSTGLEVRFTSLDIPGTSLITEKQGYFEPYLNICQQERLRDEMISFELEFTKDSAFYEYADVHFKSLWAIGLSLEVFKHSEDRLQDSFRSIHQLTFK